MSVFAFKPDQLFKILVAFCCLFTLVGCNEVDKMFGFNDVKEARQEKADQEESTSSSNASGLPGTEDVEKGEDETVSSESLDELLASEDEDSVEGESTEGEEDEGLCAKAPFVCEISGIDVNDFYFVEIGKYGSGVTVGNESGNYSYTDNLFFESEDGTSLFFNLFEPGLPPKPEPEEDTKKQREVAKKKPVIVMINPWFLPGHSYFVMAERFAKRGYLVLSYYTRGWWFSQGIVNVAGPEDMDDFTAALDWLAQVPEADMTKIGVLGTSLGAGQSLLVAGHDPRVKAVASLSGWGDIVDSIFGAETPRKFWIDFLVKTGNMGGAATGLDEIADHVYNYTNILQTVQWGKTRSAITYIDAINERNIPIYISHNISDGMFHINQMLDFYSKLTVPKRLDVNLGIHASSEFFGHVGFNSYVWDNVHDWFDHYLQGVSNELVKDTTPVSFAIRQESVASVATLGEQQQFADWPVPAAQESVSTWYLGPLTKCDGSSCLDVGSLDSGKVENNGASDAIVFSTDKLASTGVPLVTNILSSHFGVPNRVQFSPSQLPNGKALVYESAVFKEYKRIVGVPEFSVVAKATTEGFQLIAYLYDVDQNGLATLITHAPFTKWRDQPLRGLSKWSSLGDGKVLITVSMNATGYDIKAGHHLGLVVDTHDPMYSVVKDGNHNDVTDYTVSLFYDANSKLSVPLMPVPK